MIYSISDVIGTSLEETKENLLKVVEGDKIGSRHSHAKLGVRYYNNDNDILYEQKYFFDGEGKKVIDNTKSNNRLAHNFYGLMVKQTVGYV